MKKQESKQTCPKAAGRPCRPSWFSPLQPLKGIPFLRSRYNHQDDFNWVPSKTLWGSESDKITFIFPPLTWSSLGRTPAPCPKTSNSFKSFSRSSNINYRWLDQKPGIKIHVHEDLCNFGEISSCKVYGRVDFKNSPQGCSRHSCRTGRAWMRWQRGHDLKKSYS